MFDVMPDLPGLILSLCKPHVKPDLDPLIPLTGH